jgi:DNA-binding NarL/FixJ family response regulator
VNSPPHRARQCSGSAASNIGANAASVVVGGPLPRNVARIFARDGRIELLGICDRRAELVSNVENQSPDVLLLARSIVQSGLANLLRQIQARSTTKILILTDRRDPSFVETILRYGVKGCVRTATVGNHVVKAIVAVKRGDVWLERKTLAEAVTALADKLNSGSSSGARIGQPDRRNRFSLTTRESDVVALLVQGLTNKEIAKALNVGTETVKRHLQHIFIKLGVHRRTQVVRRQLLSR